VLLVVAVLAGVVALVQRHGAQAQALTSDAERIGAQALTEPNVDRSLLLSVASVKLQNRAQTRSDLFADLQQNPALIRLIRPSHIEITALRASPDGRLLAVGDSSGTVRFIDLTTWEPRGATVRLDSAVAEHALSFSPDGRTLMALAVGVTRSTLYAIDVARRRARRVLAWNGPAPQAPIGFEAVAYSPDGRQVTVTDDTEPGANAIPTAARLLLLDTRSGHVQWQRHYPLRHGQSDPHVAFMPTGTLLTSAQQGDTLLWNPHTGRILRRFPLGGLPAIAPVRTARMPGTRAPRSLCSTCAPAVAGPSSPHSRTTGSAVLRSPPTARSSPARRRMACTSGTPPRARWSKAMQRRPARARWRRLTRAVTP
jgi:WD40 repeat protein